MIDQVVNRLESSKQSSLVTLIGGDANSDQLTGGVEQSAAGSALDGDAGAFDVVWSEITIERGDFVLQLGRRISATATDAEDVLSNGRGCGQAGDRGRR